MAGEPLGNRECCLPRAAGVSYLKIGSGQLVVGMVGLQDEFEFLRAQGLQPEVVSDSEIIAIARKSNYIPNTVNTEAEYALALRAAYSAYWDKG